jgi:signal transduction histidine kinase
MFNHIRLRLTAWYVFVLLAIVVMMAGITYLMLSNNLENEVDDSLQAGARGISRQVEEQGVDSLTPTLPSEDENESEDGEDEEGHEVRYFNPASGDTFYLVLSVDGSVLANPLNLNIEGLPRSRDAETAASDGEAWGELSVGDDDYRLYSYPVRHEGETLAVVQVGRSLEEHQRQLQGALLVIGISGLVGLAVAAVGGLMLAGRALAPAREAYQRQRAFVADASHEIRTPLTVVRGNAEMLELTANAKLTAEERSYLTGILGQAQYMQRLAEDLSVLARLDQGSQVVMPTEPVDLLDLVEDAASDARILGREKRINVQASGESVTLLGDRDRLKEALLAIVDNAVRHSPAGGTIRLSLAADEQGVIITVIDEGPGIAPEHLPYIFDRFYRVDAGRSRREGGSGLGLAIARAIVHAHGGDIQVSSGEQGGAVFEISLPVRPQTAKPHARTVPDEGPKPTRGPTLHGRGP